MKKILVLFAFLAFALTAVAQDKVIPVQGGVAGVTNSTAAVKVAAYNYVFRVDLAAPFYYTYQLHLDDNSVTPTNKATVVVAGSLDNVNYKTLHTISYKSGGTDTTIIGNLTSSPVTYKFIRYTVTPDDTIWVKSMYFGAGAIK